MELFKNRPFALFCAVFMASAACGFFFVGSIKLIAIAISATLLVSATVYCTVKRRFFKICKSAFLVLLAVIIGALSSYTYFDIGYMQMRKYDGQKCLVEAVVSETQYSSDYGTAHTLRLISVNGEACDKLAYLKCDYKSSLHTGNRFSIIANATEPCDDSFEYSQKSELISNGVTIVFESSNEEDYTVIDKNYTTPEIYFKKLNAELSVRLARAVGGESGDLASAVFLADRSELDDSTRLAFSRAGTSHLLALSGLHMAIVAAIAEFFLRKLYVGKTMRSFILGALLILYLALVGFAISAVRAVIMIAIVYLGYILRSPSDPRTSLFFAGFLILLASPSAVCDIGFWMSFFATLGIIAVSPYMSSLFRTKREDGDFKVILLRIVRYIVTAVAVTLAANFAVLFFLWRFFGEVSLIAPLSNLLLAPISTLLIFFSAMTLLFYWGIPALSDIFADCTAFLGEVILNVSEGLSDLYGIVMSLKYDFAGYIVCAFAVLTLILLVIKLKHKWIAFVPAILTVIAFLVCVTVFNHIDGDKLTLTYLRDKEGEEIVLSEGGRAVVCDASEGYFSRLYLAGAMAKECCATEIDVLILTHYHSRQPQSVERFFDNCKTREIWLPEPHNDYEYAAMTELLKVANNAGVKPSVYKDGAEMTLFGEAKLNMLPYRKLDRSVEAQVGFSVSCNGESLTYLSAAYGEGELPQEALDAIGAEHLILGAHGPNEKEEFLINITDNCRDILVANGEVLKNGLIEICGEASPQIVVSPEYKRFILE